MVANHKEHQLRKALQKFACIGVVE
uniref:Uncharacterized protein n=1 Tax=Arundo donax TaxID=35708 RepID=A0A0A8YYI0_ARUDO